MVLKLLAHRKFVDLPGFMMKRKIFQSYVSFISFLDSPFFSKIAIFFHGKLLVYRRVAAGDWRYAGFVWAFDPYLLWRHGWKVVEPGEPVGFLKYRKVKQIVKCPLFWVNDSDLTVLPHWNRALEIMVRIREIIPFYGRTIQVSEIL